MRAAQPPEPLEATTSAACARDNAITLRHCEADFCANLGVRRMRLLKHIAIALHVPPERGSAALKRRDRFGLEFAVRDTPDCSQGAHFCI